MRTVLLRASCHTLPTHFVLNRAERAGPPEHRSGQEGARNDSRHRPE